MRALSNVPPRSGAYRRRPKCLHLVTIPCCLRTCYTAAIISRIRPSTAGNGPIQFNERRAPCCAADVSTFRHVRLPGLQSPAEINPTYQSPRLCEGFAEKNTELKPEPAKEIESKNDAQVGRLSPRSEAPKRPDAESGGAAVMYPVFYQIVQGYNGMAGPPNKQYGPVSFMRLEECEAAIATRPNPESITASARGRQGNRLDCHLNGAAGCSRPQKSPSRSRQQKRGRHSGTQETRPAASSRSGSHARRQSASRVLQLVDDRKRGSDKT